MTTGDTLSDPTKPIILERMEFPEPVIEVAVEPKTKGDQEKLGVALNRLAQEDPSFRVSVDHESGQTIIKGMGELISTLSSTACGGSSMSRPMSAPRRSPSARPCRSAPPSITPQEADRRLGPVRPRQDDDRAERARQGLRIREQGGRRQRAEGIYPRRAEGRAQCRRIRRARRLPHARRQGDADRRRLSRCRFRA